MARLFDGNRERTVFDNDCSDLRERHKLSQLCDRQRSAGGDNGTIAVRESLNFASRNINSTDDIATDFNQLILDHFNFSLKKSCFPRQKPIWRGRNNTNPIGILSSTIRENRQFCPCCCSDAISFAELDFSQTLAG